MEIFLSSTTFLPYFVPFSHYYEKTHLIGLALKNNQGFSPTERL
jgi:hypothetical protein